MLGSRALGRPLTALFTVVATAAAYVGLSMPATPARAADIEVTKLVGLFDQVSGYVPKLAGVGKLAAPIPTLNIAPGGTNGLGLVDLLTEARTNVLTSVDAANDLGQLKDAINGKNGSVGGRTIAFTADTSTAGTTKSLTVGVKAGRTIASGRLDIGDDSPQFSLVSASGVEVKLDLNATFTLNYDTASQAAWLTRTASTPALTIGFNASLPNPANVKAGLGILGIELDATSTFILNGVVSTSWSDPNNDGKLTFDEPGGAADDGEMSAGGSGPGLVSANITSGVLDATLKIKADTTTTLALPAATATVDVDAPNLVTDSPQVTFSAGALDAVSPFLTMSTRDLAQALKQAASAVLAMQDASGVKLPFMRGDLSNAVGAAEAIHKFLTTNVPEPTPGTLVPGLPTFTSIQDLIAKLKDAGGLPGGADMNVLNALYSSVDKKLKFDLTISRAAGTATDLNVLGAPTTGGGGTVTYTNDTLTDTSKNFTNVDLGLGAALIGRQITAGMSGAIIKQVVDADTLKLDPAPLDPPGSDGPPASLWLGGTPLAGTAYSIAAGDPKLGLIELGNALKATGGIANATAKIATAKVKPSYNLTIPFVLDLREPNTTDCDPGAGTAACPFSQTENGITRIITSLPLTADRVMLGTGLSGVKPLLTADAGITSTVDVDATVGFVGVKIGGTITACTTNSAADCSGTTASGKNLLRVGIKSMVGNGADAAGDIPITMLFDKLRAALAGGTLSNILDISINGQAYGSLTVSMPGAPNFFGSGTPSVTVTVAMADIKAPTALDVSAPQLSRLAALDVDPSNPMALFGALLSSLQSLQGVISSVPGGAAALNTKMPLVGRSFSEVIGSGVSGGGTGVKFDAGAVGSNSTVMTDPHKTFGKEFIGRRVAVGTSTAMVTDWTTNTLTLKPAISPLPAIESQYAIDSELQGVINLLQLEPTQTLQQMLDLLEAQLGNNSAVDFAVDAPVAPAVDPVLKINLDWKRSYTSQSPMNFAFDVGALGSQSMVGAKGKGVVNITATGQVKLALRLPLSAAAVANPGANLTIDPAASLVKAGVNVAADGVRVQANLGPFQASLGNPADPAGTKLRAGLGVTVSNNGTSPVTIADFFGSGLGIAVDGAGVDCGGPALDPVSTKLGMCAVFPAYLNGAPVNADPALNNFVVRLPVGSDVADSFNIGGANVGGQPRLELPTGLESALANAALNLLSFGDGFFSYLEFLESSLKAASFEGKLPVIGKDLQAGSEFIGKLRTDLTTAFEASGVPTNPNAGAIRTFLNDKLDAALPNGNPLTIDITCTTKLLPIPKPGVSRLPADLAAASATTEYRYKVVPYTNGGAKDATLPSPNTDMVKNVPIADLNGTNHNKLTWLKSTHAQGYFILREINGAGGYKKIADVSGGDTLNFTDQVKTAGDDYTAATAEPLVVPCPDSASPLEISGFTVAVDIGQGNLGDAGCTGPDCLTATLPLDLGIPGLSLKATDATGGVTGSVGWRLHLKVGLSRDDGFYVATQDTNKPEFEVGASLKFPETTSAQLAFIKVDVKDNDTAKPELKGRIAIDLRDENVAATDCTASCSVDNNRKLTLDKLTGGSISEFVHPVLDAKVDIDLHLAAKVDSGLPGISTDFVLGWAWTTDAPSDFGGLTIAFNNVSLDAGAVLSKTIKPIIQQVVDVYKPVQPIIDTLYAPIPVLSDLSKAVGGDDITIASLAEAFSTLAGEPNIGKFLAVLANIRSLVKALESACGSPTDCALKVGSFSLVKEKAVATDANPGTAQSLIAGSPSIVPNLTQRLDDKAPGNLQGSGAGGPHKGFTFPFLDDPSKIFGLIVGQDVALVEFDSGPLTLGFKFQKSFGPVYAPPPVMVVIGGGASVSLRIAAGFDTYGIRTAVESGKLTAGILDSLYFKTHDDAGKPIPVVEFEGFLEAGASVSAVVIEVGIVGGIKLTVGFFWNDPNNDGKFRFSEFLATALSNPICLFNVGGELSLYIKVFITLGISPFSVSFDFTLVSIKLLDFSLKPNCEPPPPRLGGTKDGVLYLYAGKHSATSHRGHDAWKSNNTADEAWIVRQVPAKSPDPAKIVVQGLGITEEFDDTDGKIHTVVLDGRDYTGKLQVMFNGGDKTQPFTKKAVVYTGDGEDTIRTGEGESWIDGGAAHDEITTTDRARLSVDPTTAPAAYVAGGAGPDSITVGNAINTVMGDRRLTLPTHTLTVESLNGADVTLTDAINPASVAVVSNPGATASTDGDDQISAGLGGSKIYGNNGSDKIGTANDNPQADLTGTQAPANVAYYRARANEIVGGGGSDRIKSGSANDKIWTGAKDTIDGNGFGSGDDVAAGDKNTVDTGTGSDTVYGSNAPDFVTTHSLTTQTATAFGGGSEDVLIGGAGTDKLYGGPDNDYLVAEPATVSDDKPLNDVLGAARRVTTLSDAGVSSAKTLVGGGGKDRIYGADGPATIFGDHEVDGCVLQSDPVSKQPPENPTTTGDASTHDAADLILGGEGIDTVQAGGGNDHVYTFANLDVACGNAGVDTMGMGAGADLAYGGSDGDIMHGDDGADQLYGNTGNDSAWGGEGTDRMQGNDGIDKLFGGTQGDLVIGGTSKAGEPDDGDFLYGDDGIDTLVGDNSDSDVLPAYPTDLGTALATEGGNDTIYGGADADLAYGGLEDDYIYGGNLADALEGNNGSDHIFGESGADNIIGGSSQAASAGVGRPDAGDTLSGGDNDDVITGDNAQLANATSGADITKGRSLTTERTITQLDLGHGAATGLFGGDVITGDADSDVILGQRGVDTISGNGADDYAEGGPGVDTIDGNDGNDDLVGGGYAVHSGVDQATVGQLDTGDIIRGGDHGDVVLGDNGLLTRLFAGVTASPLVTNRGITHRAITPYDLGDSPTAGTSGDDVIEGNAVADVLLAQSGADRVKGGPDDDYAEGGPDSDWIEGGGGSDDLVGGSSTINGTDSGDTAKGQPDGGDVIWGGNDSDLETGDNAFVTRNAPYNALTTRVDAATGDYITPRSLRLLDQSNGTAGILGAPDAIRFGADYLSGQTGVDLALGQDGDDQISGGSADDYAEGQGNSDIIYGDRALVGVPTDGWPGSASPDYAVDGGIDGQDDLLGGSSREKFRDAGDTVYGDGVSDFILGDNGTVKRDIDTSPSIGVAADKVYVSRYPAVLPAGAAKLRIAGVGVSTRFCDTDSAGNGCEPTGAFGGDNLSGNDGDDFIYGQDGDDTGLGGNGDDDMYGEIGDDTLSGNDGDDAILGDRGGIKAVYEDGTASVTTSFTSVPQMTYTSRLAGTVSRVVDLHHEVNGDQFVGSGTDPKMKYDGHAFGELDGADSSDRIRGGNGQDQLHGGIGDDLINGDSGGDTLFGDNGADLLWGGKGCDAALDAANAGCFTGGVFDPAGRGTDDDRVDYLLGGKGATSGPSLAGASGADIMDWRPRGNYTPGVGCTTSAWPATVGAELVDPCDWFVMTELNNDVDADNQHHQGIDWQYGGWDRDVMQGDVTGNGPNPGDRMLDWTGAYNLYTACNAAYGGFNDVRQFSPQMQDFLQRWNYGIGAGQTQADTMTAGTSAFIELALVYTQDNKAHGTGKAFPSTPGHFDNPNACGI